MIQNFKFQNLLIEIVSKIGFLDSGNYLFFGSCDLEITNRITELNWKY